MKAKLLQLVIATTLIASPLAFAVEPEKGPGKDSTSTTVPQPGAQPGAANPADSKSPAASNGDKHQGKDSTSTDVAVPAAPKEGDKK